MDYLILSFLVLGLIFFSFWLVSNIASVHFGAPAVSSPSTLAKLDNIVSGQRVLDLGCGNGSVCLALAKSAKQVYGIERSPFYYLLSKLRCLGRKNITIYYGDFYDLEWPVVDVIYCYLFPELLSKLKPKFEKSKAKIVSLDFQISGWQPVEVIKGNHHQLFVYKNLS